MVGELQRPVAMAKPTSTHLMSPIVAARWAARGHFHRAVVTRRRSYKRAQRRENKSGSHCSSASKGASKAPLESGTHSLPESADEWAKFRRSADEAAAASRKAKTSGLKKAKSSKGSGGPKDPESSASTVAKTGSAKQQTQGEGGWPGRKPRWNSYKIPKWTTSDTSVSSGARTPRKPDKLKRPKKKVAKKSSMPNQSVDSKAKTEKGSTFLQPLAPSDLPLDYWAHNCPGDNVIPANAKRVEWAGGLVLFQGTPLILFETELEARHQAGRQLRLWQAELIEHECDCLDSSRMVRGLVSPKPANLPRLPPWAAPNGWDYWAVPGRIWMLPAATERWE